MSWTKNGQVALAEYQAFFYQLYILLKTTYTYSVVKKSYNPEMQLLK